MHMFKRDGHRRRGLALGVGILLYGGLGKSQHSDGWFGGYVYWGIGRLCLVDLHGVIMGLI